MITRTAVLPAIVSSSAHLLTQNTDGFRNVAASTSCAHRENFLPVRRVERARIRTFKARRNIMPLYNVCDARRLPRFFYLTAQPRDTVFFIVVLIVVGAPCTPCVITCRNKRVRAATPVRLNVDAPPFRALPRGPRKTECSADPQFFRAIGKQSCSRDYCRWPTRPSTRTIDRPIAGCRRKFENRS